MLEATETLATPQKDAKGKDRRWLSVGVILVGSFMALLDVTIVNVALPSIQTALEASPSSLEWIISAYALSFGLVLMLAGRLGDTWGRKKMFIFGLSLFALSSVACGLAQDTPQLVLARIVQGLGAGCFLPQISATIQSLFQGRERGKALGLLGGVVGLSTALGPILGGVLLRFFGTEEGWRSVFLVNLPIGIIAIILAAKFLPETRNEKAAGRSLDPIGLLLLTAGILLLLFPLTEGQSKGWPVWFFALFAAVIPVLALFVFWEKRQEAKGVVPLLPLSLLKERSFSSGSTLGLIYFAGFSSIFFIISVFWQTGLGHSPLHAGLTILPFAIGAMISAPLGPRYVDKLGARTMTLGATLLLMSLTMVGFVVYFEGAEVHTWQLIVPLFLGGIGNGMVISPNQRFVLSQVPVDMAGVGGALVQTAQRLGTAIGISAVGTVFYSTLVINDPAQSAEAYAKSFRLALLVSIGAVAIALFASFRIPELDKDK